MSSHSRLPLSLSLSLHACVHQHPLAAHSCTSPNYKALWHLCQKNLWTLFKPIKPYVTLAFIAAPDPLLAKWWFYQKKNNSTIRAFPVLSEMLISMIPEVEIIMDNLKVLEKYIIDSKCCNWAQWHKVSRSRRKSPSIDMSGCGWQKPQQSACNDLDNSRPELIRTLQELFFICWVWLPFSCSLLALYLS